MQVAKSVFNKVTSGRAPIPERKKKSKDEEESEDIFHSNLEVIRQQLLHVTDSTRVVEAVDSLVGFFNLSKFHKSEESINILKYISRLHGLPQSIEPLLYKSFLDTKDSKFRYKVALALKYAVQHNHDFLSLKDVLNLLFETYKHDQITSSNQLDYFTQETIAQLMLIIILILNPDRVATENVPDTDLWKLENYLVHVNGKYKSEIRRSLEKMGYWSGSVSHRAGAPIGRNGFVRSGQDILGEMQNKRGINVSAHVVKTQQAEAVTTEENVSEKTQMANISLSNALEEGRTRTLQAQREREALPPSKSATGSERWWYRNTAFEVQYFYDKAKRDEAISPEDITYLRDKMKGWRYSLIESHESMINKIAEIFQIISKYQSLKTDLMLELLEHVLDEKFEVTRARVNILQAIGLHCNRCGEVPQEVRRVLHDFTNSPEGTESSDEVKQIIADILINEDDRTGENLKVFVKMLREKKRCMSALNYIQRQVSTEARSDAVKDYADLPRDILQVLLDSRKWVKEIKAQLNTLHEKQRILESAEQPSSPQPGLVAAKVLTGIATAGVSVLLDNAMSALNKFTWTQRQNEIKELERFLELCLSYSPKALEVLEDYNDLSWTKPLTPDQLDAIMDASTGENSNDDFVRSTARLILRSIEKGVKDPKYLNQAQELHLNSHIKFLFGLLASDKADRNTKIFIMITMSNIFDNESVRNVLEQMTSEQANTLIEQLPRIDVIHIEDGKLVLEEDQQEYFKDEKPSPDEYEYVSAYVTKLMVFLIEKNPEIVTDETITSKVSQLILSTKSKMTKILSSEFIFKFVTLRNKFHFLSSPVLNRIQGLAFSEIADVHVFITCAYCTSLANQRRQNIPLQTEHINFLVNLYQYKKVTLDKEDFSQWINPNIITVFREASKQGLDISEHVFNLSAHIINTTCADSEDSPEYQTVKTVLEMVEIYCEKRAGDLPPSIVDAVEDLLLESDVFDETCAGIVEQCMLAGRWISDAVIEEFSKYLWHEPSISMPFVRRLAIANENQELPDSIFSSFQMELIAMRLSPSEKMKNEVKLMGFLATPKDDDLFQRLSTYVFEGMTMSRLSLDVVTWLLSNWKGNTKKCEEVLKCLTIAASNGQTLPKEIIDAALSLGNGTDILIQLDLAIEIIRRSQQIPPSFAQHSFKKLEDRSGEIETPEQRKAITLVRTMIQHNHKLPPEVVSSYLRRLNEKKNGLTTDMVSSVIRLVESSVAVGKDLQTCKEIFSFAMESQNVTFIDMGSKGLNSLPTECFHFAELKSLRQRGILKVKSEHKMSEQDELWLLVKSSLSSADWKEEWSPELKSKLESEICSDVPFIRKIGDLLRTGKGPLNQFEHLLTEMLCIACVSATEVRNGYNDKILKTCQEILEDLTNKRKIVPGPASRSHLEKLKGDSTAWAKKILRGAKWSTKSRNVLTVLSEFKENPCDETVTNLVKVFQDESLCQEYSNEILDVLAVKRSNKNQSKFGLSETLNSLRGWFTSTKPVADPISKPEPESKPEKVELLIMQGEGRIPSVILHAYINALHELETTPYLEECAFILADYFQANQDFLRWNETALIFRIFQHASAYCKHLPRSMLQTVMDNLSDETDPLLRGECFSILKIFRERNLVDEQVWDTLFWENLSLFYEPENLYETPAAIHLLHVLMTLTHVDMKSISQKKESEWSEHLMTADMVLQLSENASDELELYSEAKEFCGGINNPQERLYVMNSIRDYMKRNSGTLSPGRIFHFLNKLRKVAKAEIKAPWKDAAAVIEKQIFYGLTFSLCEKLQEEINPDVAVVTMEQAIKEPNPISFTTLDQLIQVIDKSNVTFHHFKELLEFIKENQRGNEALRLYLKSIVDPISIPDLMTSTKTIVLMSDLPKGVEDDAISDQIKSHTKRLILMRHNFFDLQKLFRHVGAAIEKRQITRQKGLQMFENVLFQLVTYEVSQRRLPYICETLLENKVADWTSSCNEIVMEHLFAGSQGEKSAKTIAKEFEQLNGIYGSYLVDFESIVREVQDGNFKSSFGNHLTPKPICDWGKSEINAWASVIITLNEDGTPIQWSQNFLKEAVSVVSRGCDILKSYRLTPIQILSVYYTTIGKNKMGKLLQVATGSGKSTIIVALACIRTLMGYKVDIYTSSPVLAERDAKLWAPFYQMFGFTCDHNGDKGSGYTRGEKNCYKKDIVYGDTSQFQFDTLRDEYSGLRTRANRAYSYALVDEVDAMLVDDSSKLARLSSTLPGMDLLQIMYHLIWHRLHDIQRRLYAVGNDIYYLEGRRTIDQQGILHYTYMGPEGKEIHVSNLAVFILQRQDADKELEQAFIFKVKKLDDFVVNHLKNYIGALIGEHEFKENGKAIQKLPLPKPIQKFAKSQVDNWVDSALTAIAFAENVHYVVDREQIKPVDYHSTGVIQASTNWNNGLHQFLQIKHSLKVSTETVTTNFLSNMAMFQKYGSNLVGFTGTLGSSYGQSVLRDVYSVETAVIPELYYKRFQELSTKILPSQEKWLQSVVHSALHESTKKRAVLVICQTIREADLIAEELEKVQAASKNETSKTKAEIKLYTRNDQNQEKRVEQVIEGDIIVATNLAGRGTDINTTKVERHGGLHVILTFLPDSLRVEQQGFGRTARQGNKGTGELIVICPRQIQDPRQLKKSRDKEEESRLSSFVQKELVIIQTKDKLFSKFCKIYSQIRAELNGFVSETFGFDGLTPIEHTRLQAIEQQWAILLKGIDDSQTKLADAESVYDSFQNRILLTYKDIDKSISVTENCFYWIQFGNEYYRSGNTWKDNTSKAYGYFLKAKETDGDFSAGAHAGLGFCLLRGRSHWVGQNSHDSGYQQKGMDHLKDALKILYTEIGMYTTAQTLLQHRNGRTDSDLFKQLTEKVNLTGEYCNNIQGIISVVERSLRKVYATEIKSADPWSQKTWKLNDDYPSISGCSKSSKYELEFHDLTCRYDMGDIDQAKDTLENGDKIEIRVKNQNLRELMNCLHEHTKYVNQLQLDGVKSIEGALEIVEKISPKGFMLKVNELSLESLKKIIECEELKAMKKLVEWEGDDASETKYSKEVAASHDINDIPSNKKLVFKIYLETKGKKVKENERAALKQLESILGQNLDLSVELHEVSQSAINENWKDAKVDEYKDHQASDNIPFASPGILQAFSQNTSSFKNLSHEEAANIITSLRQKNIPFVLRLEPMSFDDANYALKHSGRAVEDIIEKELKEMGYQFSSVYVPIEIIQDLKQRGLVLMPVFAENAFVPWRSVITMAIIASVQVAAGGLLICTGFGATVGMGLVTEGMADYVNAHRAYSSRNFSWTDYAIQKSVSLTISCVSMGMSNLKDGAKGIKTIFQGIGTEVAEQAGTRLVTDVTLDQGLNVASSNLKSLATKYIAVKGGETVARTSLNMAVNSILEFSFESMKSSISSHVEMNVKNQFRSKDFFDVLSTCAAVDFDNLLRMKVDTWTCEVTNPKSNFWNKAWDSVALPLCQGILSDEKYLGSKFSMGMRLAGMTHAWYCITTVVEKVCFHIFEKLESELKHLTPAYAIHQKCGLKLKEAEEVAEMMTFEEIFEFEVTKYPPDSSLEKYKLTLKTLKSLFEGIKNKKAHFSKDGEDMSRLIAIVVKHLTNHIIGVANRQLAQPMTTLAVGALVNKISQEIQSNYLVREDQMSEDQKRAKELRSKDPSELNREEKAFLAKHSSPITFADQIRGNAKDYTIAYQKREMIAILQSLTEEQKSSKEIPEDLTPEQMATIRQVLTGAPADMIVTFMLGKLNNADVKLVTDPNYVPTEEDKAMGTKIIVWEAGENAKAVGHYTLMDAATGEITDFVGGGKNDCLYNVFSEITGKSTDQLKAQAAVFVACNGETIAKLHECQQWLVDRYPEEAAKILHLGGAAGHRSRTPFRTRTEKGSRRSRSRSNSTTTGKDSSITKGPGVGSKPEPGERRRQVKAVNSAIKENREFEFVTESGSETLTSDQLVSVVAGHLTNEKCGTKGTDKNTAILTRRANTQMYHHFEKRVNKFLDWANSQDFIAENSEIIRVGTRLGEIGTITLDDDTIVEVPKDVTCFMYIDPESISHLSPDQQQQCWNMFTHVTQEPVRETKSGENKTLTQTTYTDQSGTTWDNACGIKISNFNDPNANSYISNDVSVYDHGETYTVESSSQDGL